MDKKAAAMHEATDIGAPRLTKAQHYLLEIVGKRHHECMHSYRPAKALRDAGLVVLRMTRPRLVRVEITPAGSALLRSLQEKSNG